MRLINTTSLELEFFMDVSHVPPYAILSHTWADGEVTFQDLSRYASASKPDGDGDAALAVRRLPGFRKIELTCRQALADGFSYAWVDTCCIDKTSSAELTEAINSMYAWYQTSVVCYVLLTDFNAEDPVIVGEGKKQEPSAPFTACRWFTRGWTLQELLAPKTVQFFDAAWKLRGTKASLAPAIAAITHIEESVLLGTTALDAVSLGCRMAWAAKRTTTRTEDIAYCLLGIFDVNMPMLYGEGSRAFIRLQEEIMRETNDMSLFAWRAAEGDNGQRYRGLLATSPAEFADAGTVTAGSDVRLDSEFAPTNKGVRIKARLVLEAGIPILRLNCALAGKPVGIYLRQHGAGVYARSTPDRLAVMMEDGQWVVLGTSQDAQLYISKRLSPTQAALLGGAHRHAIHLRHGFAFTSSTGPLGSAFERDQPGTLMSITWVHPEDQWDAVRGLFLTGGSGFTAVVMGSRGSSATDMATIAVGLEQGLPWLGFLDATNSELIANGGLFNLEAVGRFGKRATTRTFKGLTLRLEQDVMDGETVYCVDLSTAAPHTTK